MLIGFYRSGLEWMKHFFRHSENGDESKPAVFAAVCMSVGIEIKYHKNMSLGDILAISWWGSPQRKTILGR
jgi:hypothetical protein